MKPTAPHLLHRTAILCVIGGAVALFGVWLFMRPGPDFAGVSRMVPFEMPDGRMIHVQEHEVTIAEWNACHADNICALHLRAPANTAGSDYPATGISWVDANEYVTWINQKSRHVFRLPTVAEWTEIASAVLPQKPDPIFTDPELTWASAYQTEELGSRQLEPTGSFSTTAQGIFDLDGNVWEWTQDCYSGVGNITSDARCPAYYAVGEHQAVIPFLVRDPARGGCAVGAPPAHLGMRLVSDSAPRDR